MREKPSGPRPFLLGLRGGAADQLERGLCGLAAHRPRFTPNTSWPVYTTVAAPLVLLTLGIPIPLPSASPAGFEDEDREWLSRVAAWLLLLVVLWIVVCTLVLILPTWGFPVPVWGKSPSVRRARLGLDHRSGGRKFGDEGQEAREQAWGAPPPPSMLVSLAMKMAAPVFAAAFLWSGAGHQLDSHDPAWARIGLACDARPKSSTLCRIAPGGSISGCWKEPAGKRFCCWAWVPRVRLADGAIHQYQQILLQGCIGTG